MYRIGKEEVEAFEEVVNSKQLFRVGDPVKGHLGAVEKFEREWAEKIGSTYSVCLSGGGTAALICGLVGMGVGPGDEVIVPGYTFMATATAVLAVGAIPVIAEIDESMTLDLDDIERKIGRHTKAVIPVHMVGLPADMEKINRVAKKHNLKVLEDACQADGVIYKGKRLGSWGDAGAFSFNFYKIISVGEGGALVTDDRELYERALIYSDSGAAFRPFSKNFRTPVFIGMQFRASEIMGAVMRCQLQRLDGILGDLQRIKKMFISGLSGSSGINFSRSNDEKEAPGTVVSFKFSTQEKARKFAAAGTEGRLPIDTGKHVYCNWEPLLEKRAGAHPALNPFFLPQNKGLRMDYSRDMCPATLDLCSRTVFISIDPDWSDIDVKNRIESCRTAGALL